MSEQEKQAWRDYLHQLRQYQRDLNSYYYDLVEWLASRNGAPTTQDDDTGSNPGGPPPPPKPPGS